MQGTLRVVPDPLTLSSSRLRALAAREPQQPSAMVCD